MMPVFPLLQKPGGTLDDLDEREDDHLSNGNVALVCGEGWGWHISIVFLSIFYIEEV